MRRARCRARRRVCRWWVVMGAPKRTSMMLRMGTEMVRVRMKEKKTGWSGDKSVRVRLCMVV